MEAIIKYSRLVEDDGGFDQLKKDLDKLGDDLKKKASEMKGVFSIIDPGDNKAIEKLQEEIEGLKKSYTELAETNKMLKKTEEDYKKALQDDIKMQEKKERAVVESTKALDKLYVEMEQHRVALKAVNQMEKEGLVTVEEAAIARGRAKVMMKELSQEINRQEKALLQSNTLSKKENDLIQAKLALENKQIETLDQVRERMKNLRIVVQNTNITTEEGKQAIREMNAEIDELTDTLSENSDKFIRNKINIGNYKESIIEAIEETGLFKTNIALIDGVMGKLIARFKKATEQTEENTQATNENSRATTNLKKVMSGLGTALKATGIMLVLGLLASMFSIFKQGRAGVIKTEQAMAVFNTTMKVVINTLAELGKGLIMWFKSFGPSFANIGNYVDKLGLKFEWLWTKMDPRKSKADLKAIEIQMDAVNKKIDENKKLEEKMSGEAWEKMGDAVGSFSERLADAKASIKTSVEGIEKAFIIADRIRSAKIELIGLKKEMSALEVASDDSTQGLRSMLKATEQVGIKGQQVFQKEIDILKMQLQLANVKAKADLEAAGMSVAHMNVMNGGLQTQIAFAKELLALNKSMNPTDNPLDDNLLEEQQNALQELLEKQSEYSTFRIQLAKQEREIKRDLFEQDLDLLIDLIDKDKTLSEQYVNDVTKNFEGRVKEMQDFFIKFAKTTQHEMDLFTRTASDQGLDLKFKVAWKDDGSFDVLMNQQTLALDNIIKLNEQLQGANLSEIAINRFREFVMETKAAQKDFKDINIMLAETKRKILEISGEHLIDEKELERLRSLNAEYAKLNTSKELSKKERDAILKKIEDLEKRKTEIQEEAEEKRLHNRIDAIDMELKAVEAGSEKAIELQKEKTEIETQLEEKKYEKIKKSMEDVLAKKSKWEQFAEELKEIFEEILDKFVEVSQKQVQATEERISKQQQATDKQHERAKSGLENTLAFEQRELAKREAEKIKAQRKLERAEKVKALWTSYTKNADNKDEKNPILKTLRDFAILEAFAASFGEGGLAEDKIPTDGRGITRGRSHRGRQGGIPVLIEGNEGFFSGREVANLGKDNFYAIKEMAGRGPIEKAMFRQQRERFVMEMPGENFNDNRIVDELKGLKEVIASKPSSEVNLPEVVDGILTFVETVTQGNKTKRNHYKIKRPRL